jgi:hypothetical protein
MLKGSLVEGIQRTGEQASDGIAPDDWQTRSTTVMSLSLSLLFDIDALRCRLL